jgi:hypothetical protein
MGSAPARRLAITLDRIQRYIRLTCAAVGSVLDHRADHPDLANLADPELPR